MPSSTGTITCHCIRHATEMAQVSVNNSEESTWGWYTTLLSSELTTIVKLCKCRSSGSSVTHNPITSVSNSSRTRMRPISWVSTSSCQFLSPNQSWKAIGNLYHSRCIISGRQSSILFVLNTSVYPSDHWHPINEPGHFQLNQWQQSWTGNLGWW